MKNTKKILPVLLILGVAILPKKFVPAQTMGSHGKQAINSTFSVKRAGPVVEILHADKSAPVLRFNPDDGFVTLAESDGSIREVVDTSGLPRHGWYPFDYSFNEKITEHYDTTKEWTLNNTATGFTINGVLNSSGSSVEYTFTADALSENELRFEVQVNSPEVNRIYLKFDSPKDEHIFGFGEQFSFLDMKGQRVPLWVMEKGIGRGLEPLSSTLMLMPFPAPMDPIDALSPEIKTESHFGDHSFATYTPIPYFLSSQGRALVLENTEYSVFDFREEESAQIELWASRMSGRLFVGATPKETLEAYTAFAGRMNRLPDWMVNGLQIAGHSGSAETRKIVYDAVETYGKLGIPITMVNIHDWQGRRTGDLFIKSRLWWTFEHDDILYPDWEEMVQEFRAKGIRTAIYYNPMMAVEAGEQKENLRRDVYKLAKEAGYLVRKQDGSPYIVSSGIIKAGLIDLTNPAAREWMKDLMKEQVRVGVSAWMADFAEGLPHDAKLFSGEDAAAYHNRYTVEYAKLNMEVLTEMGVEDEVNFWTRSGYTHSPRYSTGFFTGDQLNSWDEYDGAKTVVTSLLNGGLSGFPFYIFGTGGFWTILPDEVFPKLPKEITKRVPEEIVPQLHHESTRELRARKLEMIAFASYSMRAVSVDDPDFDDHFIRFASIWAKLAPYRAKLVSEASEKGIPPVRHMMLEYPEDPEVYKLRYQWMYGTEFLVHPVLEPGANKVSVYLPAGKWVHLFNQKTYGKRNSGGWVEVDSPVGEPAVFYKEGSTVGEELVKELRASGVL